MKSSEFSLAVHSSGGWPAAVASPEPLPTAFVAYFYCALRAYYCFRWAICSGVIAFLEEFIIYLDALDLYRVFYYITTDSFFYGTGAVAGCFASYWSQVALFVLLIEVASVLTASKLAGEVSISRGYF